jgi:hypothetical protein
LLLLLFCYILLTWGTQASYRPSSNSSPCARCSVRSLSSIRIRLSSLSPLPPPARIPLFSLARLPFPLLATEAFLRLCLPWLLRIASHRISLLFYLLLFYSLRFSSPLLSSLRFDCSLSSLVFHSLASRLPWLGFTSGSAQPSRVVLFLFLSTKGVLLDTCSTFDARDRGGLRSFSGLAAGVGVMG